MALCRREVEDPVPETQEQKLPMLPFLPSLGSRKPDDEPLQRIQGV
jgi:hypothetical protein